MRKRIIDEIIKDASRAGTASIMDCIRNCLREEEWATAAVEINARIAAAIEAAFIYADRQQRLKPGRN